MTKKVANNVPLKRVVVFLPCANVNFSPEFFESYLKARTYFQHTMNNIELVEYFPKFSSNLAAVRSLCVAYMIEGFKEYKPDTSIWLDIDHNLPYDTLVRLLSHDEPVVCGMYYLKGKPFHPIIYKKGPYDKALKHYLNIPIYDYPSKGLFEVDNTGMGCAKIDREVFLKLNPPYFYYREHSMLESSALLELLVKYGIENNTEDFPFWDQVTEAGYKIMIDSELKLLHKGSQMYGEKNWLYYKRLHGLGDQKVEE